jgi:hypothetical protein
MLRLSWRRVSRATDVAVFAPPRARNAPSLATPYPSAFLLSAKHVSARRQLQAIYTAICWVSDCEQYRSGAARSDQHLMSAPHRLLTGGWLSLVDGSPPCQRTPRSFMRLCVEQGRVLRKSAPPGLLVHLLTWTVVARLGTLSICQHGAWALSGLHCCRPQWRYPMLLVLT